MKAKKNTNGIKKTPFILGAAFIALGCTLGISSFAWFYLPQSTRQVEGMDGEATGSYFSIVNQETKIADGTSKNPYGIKTAKQLYYFNWLQDLGYFNKDENGDGFIDQQYYFVLMDDIDASNYVLPPAGTKEYPFVGNFEGNGYTISNLKISNSWGNLTDKPKGAKQDGALLSSAEIVGFFGIVGQYSSGASTTADSVTTGSVNCKAKDGSAKTATYTIRSVSGTGDSATTTYVNAVNNLYFDKLEVSTVANETLAGLLAGYVNGQMQYCGVRSGNFSFGTNVGVLTDDVLKEGNNANTKLSKYSLIGDYNSNNFDWAGKPSSKSSDSGTEWGGTIDMQDVHKRLTYMVKSTKAGTESSYTTYGEELYTTRGTKIDYASNSTSYGTFESTTLIPINIDNDVTQNFYDSTVSESTSNQNTGYIVGANSKSTNFSVQSRKINESNYNVSNSFAGEATYTKYEGTTDRSNLRLLTILPTSDSSSPIYQIDDEHNKSYDKIDDSLSRETYLNLGLVKYESVRENLNDIFGAAPVLNGTMLNHYLRWSSAFSITSESAIDNWQTFKKAAKINGTSYEAYEFLRASINFSVLESGTFVAIFAPYTTGTDTASVSPIMNGMIHVTRDSAGSVTSKKRIDKVYKDSNGKIKYTYADSSVLTESGYNASNETLVYNYSNWCWTTQNKIYSMYYCEIPLMPGDYVFARCDLKSGYSGCSYVYIDIGANKGDTTPTPTTTTIPPIDFVYYSDPANKVIKKINSTDSDGKADYVPSKLTCAVAGKPTTIYFYRVLSSDGTKESIVLYYVNSAGDNATLTWTGTDTPEEETKDVYTTSN